MPILFVALSVVVLVGLAITTDGQRSGSQRDAPRDPREDEDRETWRMPSVALLSLARSSRRTRLIALCTVRGYAIIAMALLLVKAIQLAIAGRG